MFFPSLGLKRFAAMCIVVAYLNSMHVNVNAQVTLRVATYNASLYGKAAGEINERLRDGEDAQAEKVAAIIQSVRPDVLLINEIDYDADGATAKLLAQKFIAKPQGKREPIEYPYVYAAPSNTGVDSGLDLNHNGKKGEPNDAWGYGKYPGQYSMALFSRYPIDEKKVRTFQRFLWKDMPGARRPIDPESDKPYYDDETWNALRLSSKNHIDVPINIDGRTLHVLASHPTPPVFDGPEDRNGCRNHDEIRFWNDYLAGDVSTHLIDDGGTRGGLLHGASFVILGDLNSDPEDGDSRRGAIRSLLHHPDVTESNPRSEGGFEASKSSRDHDGESRLNTAFFGRGQGMRVDYALPSRSLLLKKSRVFWPLPESDDHRLISASDHRMVWIEVQML